MYNELTNKLYHCANEVFCSKCNYSSDCGGMKTMIGEAANAIKELQKKYDETQDALITADITRIYLEDVLKYIKTLAENYKAHNRWIPVTERLPEKNQEVLIFLFGEDPYIAWHNGEYWCTEDFRLDEPDDWQPTHWFPLPQPPEDGES